jgi:hypothetical protein
MLRETHAKSASYDARNDTLVLSAEDECGRSGNRDAQLLLDAKGFLVGVDLEGGGLGRLLVMLGPHEAVEKQVKATVQVDGSSVTVLGAKKSVRGHEKNPYV